MGKKFFERINKMIPEEDYDSLVLFAIQQKKQIERLQRELEAANLYKKAYDYLWSLVNRPKYRVA